MARKRLMESLSAVVLATVAVLFVAALLPMLFGATSGPSSVGGVPVQAATRDLYTLERPMRLAVAPNLLLLSGRLRADTAVPGQGTKNAAKLVLEHPIIELEVAGARGHADGLSNTLVAAASDIVDALFERLIDGGFEALDVRQGTVVVRSSGVVSETLTDVKASLTLARRSSLTAQGSFTVRGLRMDFEGTSGLVTNKDAAKTNSLPVKFMVKSAALNAAIDGKLSVAGPLALTGHIETSIPQLWQLARWLGIAAPENTVLKDIAIKSQLGWAKGILAFDKATIDLDGQQATGALALNYRSGRPALEGTLSFKTFDIAPYVHAFMPSGSSPEALSSTWSSFHTRLLLVLHANSDLRVSTPKLLYAGNAVGRGAATLSTRSGKLHADVTELDVSGTKSSMQVVADMNGAFPHYAVRGRLDMANVGPILASLFEKELIEGRGVAQIDVSGAGDSFGQLLRSATGKVSLAAGEGARIAADLKAITVRPKDADKAQLTEAGWGAIAKGQTALDGFDVRLDVANGAALVKKGHVQAGALTLETSGRVDFVARQLDLHLRPTPGKMPAGKQLKTADPSPSASVALRGPWESPTIRFDEGRWPKP